MSVTIAGVSKYFVGFHALNDVSLEVPSGGLVALLGPSGCGKTTLLRIVAGLDHADHGRIHFDGEDMTAVHARDRRIGFVFQHYALFKHMTVRDNIAFGLTVRPRRTRPRKSAIAARVDELLSLVQLEDLGGRYPTQLSGGQRQRVALARALAVDPRVLLTTNPSVRSMRGCARSCAAGCANCTIHCISPACLSPMIWMKPWKWPTKWWS